MQTCLQLQWLLATAGAARQPYISRQTAAGNRDCSAEALQYMRQAERSRIYEEACCKLVCNCNGFSQMCGPQGTLISPNMIPMQQNVALPRRYSICGKQSDAEYTKKFRHLNRKETQTNRRNTLRNFPLHGFNKHIPWFRCSGKGKHLNPAARQNPALNQLTTNVLQDFQKLCP